MSAISVVSPSTRRSSTPAPCCVRRWPTLRGSIAMPTVRAIAWWRGSRPTIAWCWSNEYPPHFHAPGAAGRDRALSVDGVVLPGSVRLRTQNQPVADRDRAAALSAGIRSDAGVGGDQGGGSGAVAG